MPRRVQELKCGAGCYFAEGAMKLLGRHLLTNDLYQRRITAWGDTTNALARDAIFLEDAGAGKYE